MLRVREHPRPGTLVRGRQAVVNSLYSVPHEQRDDGKSRHRRDETFAAFHFRKSNVSLISARVLRNLI